MKDTDKSIIKTVKTGTCSTLSGKSKLEYAISADPAGNLFFAIISADGGGFFSKEYVAWTDIVAAMDEMVPRPITSMALRSLFKGKSVNTPGFLLAVLVKEGLLLPMEGKKRLYEQADPEAWLEEMQKALSGKPKKKAQPKRKRKAAAG